MFDDQRLAPLSFGVLSIPVINVGKGAPGPGGHDKNGGDHTPPEEHSLQMIQNAGNGTVLKMSIVEN